MARGDEWRLPGLGKLYCDELPPRVPVAGGGSTRSLDSGKPVRCSFTPFRPTLAAALDEEAE